MSSSSSSSVQTAKEPTQLTLVLYGDNDEEIATFKYIETAEEKIVSIAYQATGGPVYLMAEDMIEDLEAWIQEFHPENVNCRGETLMEMYSEFRRFVFGSN